MKTLYVALPFSTNLINTHTNLLLVHVDVFNIKWQILLPSLKGKGLALHFTVEGDDFTIKQSSVSLDVSGALILALVESLGLLVSILSPAKSLRLLCWELESMPSSLVIISETSSTANVLVSLIPSSSLSSLILILMSSSSSS